MTKDQYTNLVKQCLKDAGKVDELDAHELAIVNFAYLLEKDYFLCYQTIVEVRKEYDN